MRNAKLSQQTVWHCYEKGFVLCFHNFLVLTNSSKNKCHFQVCRCRSLGAEVPRHCQEQLTQTLIVRLLKTHLFWSVAVNTALEFWVLLSKLETSEAATTEAVGSLTHLQLRRPWVGRLLIHQRLKQPQSQSSLAAGAISIIFSSPCGNIFFICHLMEDFTLLLHYYFLLVLFHVRLGCRISGCTHRGIVK